MFKVSYQWWYHRVRVGLQMRLPTVGQQEGTHSTVLKLVEHVVLFQK